MHTQSIIIRICIHFILLDANSTYTEVLYNEQYSYSASLDSVSSDVGTIYIVVAQELVINPGLPIDI